MFDKFWNDVNQLSAPQQVMVDFDNNVNINRNTLVERLRSIDTIDEKELYEMIKQSYSSILNNVIFHKDEGYIKLMMTPKFITSLTQVVGAVTLVHSEQVSCNRLAYEYLTLIQDQQDDYTKQLFFTLSKVVNRQYIPCLTGIGLPEKLASYIALARFSSEDELVNVKRMNFVIMTSPKELMTEQMIVFIYERLFDRVTTLIEATMLDVINDEDEWVTEDIEEVYSVISLAMLDILESMRSAEIGKVLRSYTSDYNAYYSGRPTRFSMNSISGDYQRILDVIEILKLDGVYVL